MCKLCANNILHPFDISTFFQSEYRGVILHMTVKINGVCFIPRTYYNVSFRHIYERSLANKLYTSAPTKSQIIGDGVHVGLCDSVCIHTYNNSRLCNIFVMLARLRCNAAAKRIVLASVVVLRIVNRTRDHVADPSSLSLARVLEEINNYGRCGFATAAQTAASFRSQSTVYGSNIYEALPQPNRCCLLSRAAVGSLGAP